MRRNTVGIGKWILDDCLLGNLAFVSDLRAVAMKKVYEHL